MKNAFVRGAFRAALAVAILLPVAAVATDLDHIHLVADDIQEGREWYVKHLGGTIPEGSTDIFMLGDTVFKIRKPDGEIYNGEFTSNAGTAIDHISFSVPNVQAKMDELEAAGIKVKRWGTHGKKLEALAGVFTDPWGTKIEILKDDDLLGFHHVHLKSPYPKDTAEWYANVLGVEVGRYKNLTQIYALRFDSMYIFVQRAIHALKPADKSSIEHFNMKLPDFEAQIDRLKGMEDIEFLHGLHSHTGHMRATVIGPDGVTVELKDNLPD